MNCKLFSKGISSIFFRKSEWEQCRLAVVHIGGAQACNSTPLLGLSDEAKPQACLGLGREELHHSSGSRQIYQASWGSRGKEAFFDFEGRPEVTWTHHVSLTVLNSNSNLLLQSGQKPFCYHFQQSYPATVGRVKANTS